MENVSWASLLGNLSCGQVEGVCSTLVEAGVGVRWSSDEVLNRQWMCWLVNQQKHWGENDQEIVIQRCLLVTCSDLMGVSWGLMLVFWWVKGVQWRLNLIVVACGYIIIIEGSLEAKLPTIWADGKAEVARGREERRGEERRGEEKRREEKESEERRCRCGKGLKSREGLCFCSLKRRVRSHSARWEMKTCTPLWHEAHLAVNMCKTHHSRTAFGSWDVEKVHAIAVRSTCRSQNVQSTPTSEHFWKLTCRKSAHRCGAKHISKSKCTKHTSCGALFKLRCRNSGRRRGAKHISRSEC